MSVTHEIRNPPETLAERFAMAMAEGGYPLLGTKIDPTTYSGVTIAIPPRYLSDPGFWKAKYRAVIVCGERHRRCFDCYVREGLEGVRPGGSECTHEPEVWV